MIRELVPAEIRRQLRGLKFAQPEVIVYDVDLFGARVLAVGAPDWGSYDWIWIDSAGKVLGHSDASYGCAGIALRDGLMTASEDFQSKDCEWVRKARL
jgi:hypothetical protein